MTGQKELEHRENGGYGSNKTVHTNILKDVDNQIMIRKLSRASIYYNFLNEIFISNIVVVFHNRKPGVGL